MKEGLREGSLMKLSTPNQEDYGGMRNKEDPDENNSELWFKTMEEDITTNGKGLQRTATPPGGWPKVYLAAHPAYNIAAETLSKWGNITKLTIWACLYWAKYKSTEAGRMKARDMIKNVIKKLVYVKHNESIAAIFPDQDLPPKDDNRYLHLYHLLIVSLDPQQALRLLDLEVVVTTEATILFLPRNHPDYCIYSR